MDAYLTIDDIITYFHSVIDIRPPTTTTLPPPTTPAPLPIFTYSVILIVLVACSICPAYYAFLECRKRWMWKHREYYWNNVHVRTYNNRAAALEALENSYLSGARTSITQGAFVDCFNEDGHTLLHIAVGYHLVEMVEMLIRFGADRQAESIEGITAQQLATHNLTCDLDDEDREKLTEIAEVFEKYQDKIFHHHIVPVPFRKFRVYFIDQSLPVLKFIQRYCKLSSKPYVPRHDMLGEASHILVPTDGDVYTYDPKPLNALYTFYQVVFGRATVLPMEWAKKCLKSSRYLNDYNLRVTKVKYNGIVYPSLDDIKFFARGRRIPYGAGIVVHLMTDRYGDPKFEKKSPLLSLISWGFKLNEVCKDPMKAFFPLPYREDAPRPYYRHELRPDFIVYDSETLDTYTEELGGSDLSKFTIMSLHEFTVFILELRVTYHNSQEDLAQFP